MGAAVSLRCISRGSGEVLGPSPLPCLSPTGRAGAVSHPPTALGTGGERGKAVPGSAARGQPCPALACLRPCPAPAPSGRPAGRGAGGGRAGPRRPRTRSERARWGRRAMGAAGAMGNRGMLVLVALLGAAGPLLRAAEAAEAVSAERSLAWGPGLEAGLTVPVRYFYIQAVSAAGHNFSRSPPGTHRVLRDGQGREGTPCPGLQFRRRTRLELPTPLPLLLPSLLPVPVPCGGCAMAVRGPARRMASETHGQTLSSGASSALSSVEFTAKNLCFWR